MVGQHGRRNAGSNGRRRDEVGRTYEGHLLNPISTPASSIDCGLFIETGDFQ